MEGNISPAVDYGEDVEAYTNGLNLDGDSSFELLNNRLQVFTILEKEYLAKQKLLQDIAATLQTGKDTGEERIIDMEKSLDIPAPLHAKDNSKTIVPDFEVSEGHEADQFLNDQVQNTQGNPAAWIYDTDFPKLERTVPLAWVHTSSPSSPRVNLGDLQGPSDSFLSQADPLDAKSTFIAMPFSKSTLRQPPPDFQPLPPATTTFIHSPPLPTAATLNQPPPPPPPTSGFYLDPHPAFQQVPWPPLPPPFHHLPQLPQPPPLPLCPMPSSCPAPCAFPCPHHCPSVYPNRCAYHCLSAHTYD